MITKIRLKNWKSHLESQFEFSKGVNAFIGQMGAGKTSVMDAISFALYGTFPAHQGRKLSLDELIMNQPQKKQRAEVELFLKIQDKSYAIKRVVEHGRGTTMAEIRQDGNLVEVNPRGVTEVVEKVLQMDYDLFSRAVYSEQNALDYFLNIPSGHRRLIIDRMLRLERFEKAREASVALSNKLEQQGEDKSRIVSELEREKPGEKREALEKELDRLKKEAREVRTEALDTTSERKRLEGRIFSFEENETLLNDSNVRLEGMRSGLNEIEESLKVLRARLKGMGPIRVRHELERTEKLVRAMESELEKRTRGSEKGRETVASLNTEIRLLSDEMKRLEGLGAKCPVCESRVSQEKKEDLLRARRDRTESLRREVSMIAVKVKEINQEREKLEKGLKEAGRELERLSTLKEDASRLDSLRKRREDYHRQMKQIRQTIKRLEKESRGMDLKSLRKNLQDKRAKEASLMERLSGLKDRVGEREERAGELRSREGMLKRYREEVKENVRISRELKKFTNVLLLTQDQLRSEFLKAVNGIMERIWGELYPYGDFEGIRLAIERDYVLQLKGPGGWVSVEGVVSGGERSMACLALRIAFSLAFIPNLRWLILDEPTHNLDSNAIERFAQVLKEKMTQFAEQVFLITHEERISEGVTGRLYRLERDKEQNGPTMVSEN